MTEYSSEELTRINDLLTAIHDEAVPAVILYGLFINAQSALVQNALEIIIPTENYLTVALNLRDNVERSRAEIIHQLATSVVNVAGHDDALLADLSPNQFHTVFLEQVLQTLSPATKLLFVFEAIDLQDRSQLSKLNNLLLPLLRRLAALDRLKFILTFTDREPEKIDQLLRPIFNDLRLIHVAPLASEEEEQIEDSWANNENPKDLEEKNETKRPSVLLWILFLVNLVLLVNLFYLLLRLQTILP